MKLYTGIVLKHHVPYKHTIALFDRALGHIRAIAVHNKLSAGTVLAYTMASADQRFFIKNLTILDIPINLAKNNILFFHHIIELCYSFIPEGVTSERIYDLLLFVFSQEAISKQKKKRILCILYVLLGLYVDDESPYNAYVYELAREPFDAMIDKDVDGNIEKIISRWLYQCIMIYVYKENLKTAHFLDEM